MKTLLQSLLLIVALAGSALPAADAPQVDTSDPAQLITSVSDAMLQALDANRAEYRKDPAKIDSLVERIMLPHFDSQYAARLVLGRYWTGATPEQRQRFIDAFYRSMLRNYGKALVDFTADRMKVFPYQGKADASNATVRTQVRKSDGSTVAVNYSLRRTPQGWKAWDVVIEGVSYVKSFRDDFGGEIERSGLDALIARLETQGAAPPAARKG